MSASGSELGSFWSENSSNSNSGFGNGSIARASSASGSPMSRSLQGSGHSERIDEDAEKNAENGADHETPGRPVSEYAEAYVRMMEDREAGVALQNSIVTPHPDDEEGDNGPFSVQNSSSAPTGRQSPPQGNPPTSTPRQQQIQPRSPEMEAASSSSSSTAPMGLRPMKSASGAAPSSSSSSQSSDQRYQSNYPSNNQGDGRNSFNPRQHRRTPSNVSFSAPPDDPNFDDEEEDTYYSHQPRSRHGSSTRKPKTQGRSNMPPHASVSPPSSGNGSNRGSSKWHARRDSNASGSSGNSDSPRQMQNTLRNSGRESQQTAPTRSLTSSSGQVGNNQKARSTLFYIRRRIHAIRAFSLLMLITVLLPVAISWARLVPVLSRSQQRRTLGCNPNVDMVMDVAKGTDFEATVPSSGDCLYFNHDMTPYLAVSGVWMAAGIGLAIANVSASFMFYWRHFTRLAFGFNLAMFFGTIIVLNWTITLVAFSHEHENWRKRSDHTIYLGQTGNRDGAVLKSASIGLLTGASLFWFFNFLLIILFHQLRKYVMTKPRYCCWPLEGFCCGAELRPYGLPTPVDPTILDLPTTSLLRKSASSVGSLNADSLNSSNRRVSRLPDSSIGYAPNDDDASLMPHAVDEEAGVIITSPKREKSRRSKEPSSSSRSSRASQPLPEQDLSPLISSLQNIHTTVNMLASKVEAMENRESAPAAAPSSYVDPFAYGRQI